VRKTFDMAGENRWPTSPHSICTVASLQAVEIACQEIGLDDDDPRDLTVTGGLPYFGGPGNNYVMHSIAAMVERIPPRMRRQPGAFGLVTANGNYVHQARGRLYSTTPLKREWVREAPAALQRELGHAPEGAVYPKRPRAQGTIESYTVVHSKTGPEWASSIGVWWRMECGLWRILPRDVALFADLQARDALGRPGQVRQEDGPQRVRARVTWRGPPGLQSRDSSRLFLVFRRLRAKPNTSRDDSRLSRLDSLRHGSIRVPIALRHPSLRFLQATQRVRGLRRPVLPAGQVLLELQSRPTPMTIGKQHSTVELIQIRSHFVRR